MATNLTNVIDTCKTEPGLGWWAIYTRHHHEHTITDLLTAKGIEVFLPTFQSSRQWKDRKKVITLPLFPCYLFVREDSHAKLRILTTPGVHVILTRGEQCAVIPDADVQNIMHAVQSPRSVEPHP
jgi:transcription antitermination factor NusG